MARDSGSLAAYAPAPFWCGSGVQPQGKLRFMSISLSDKIVRRGDREAVPVLDEALRIHRVVRPLVLDAAREHQVRVLPRSARNRPPGRACRIENERPSPSTSTTAPERIAAADPLVARVRTDIPRGPKRRARRRPDTPAGARRRSTSSRRICARCGGRSSIGSSGQTRCADHVLRDRERDARARDLDRVHVAVDPSHGPFPLGLAADREQP